jgi:putative transposase
MAEQIVNLLRQVEVVVANGKTLSQTCKEARPWSSLKVNQARRLKKLEQANAELKRLVSQLSLEKLVLKDIASGDFQSLNDGAVR